MFPSFTTVRNSEIDANVSRTISAYFAKIQSLYQHLLERNFQFQYEGRSSFELDWQNSFCKGNVVPRENTSVHPSDFNSHNGYFHINRAYTDTFDPNTTYLNEQIPQYDLQQEQALSKQLQELQALLGVRQLMQQQQSTEGSVKNMKQHMCSCEVRCSSRIHNIQHKEISQLQQFKRPKPNQSTDPLSRPTYSPLRSPNRKSFPTPDSPQIANKHACGTAEGVARHNPTHNHPSYQEDRHEFLRDDQYSTDHNERLILPASPSTSSCDNGTDNEEYLLNSGIYEPIDNAIKMSDTLDATNHLWEDLCETHFADAPINELCTLGNVTDLVEDLFPRSSNLQQFANLFKKQEQLKYRCHSNSGATITPKRTGLQKQGFEQTSMYSKPRRENSEKSKHFLTYFPSVTTQETDQVDYLQTFHGNQQYNMKFLSPSENIAQGLQTPPSALFSSSLSRSGDGICLDASFSSISSGNSRSDSRCLQAPSENVLNYREKNSVHVCEWKQPEMTDCDVHPLNASEFHVSPTKQTVPLHHNGESCCDQVVREANDFEVVQGSSKFSFVGHSDLQSQMRAGFRQYSRHQRTSQVNCDA